MKNIKGNGVKSRSICLEEMYRNARKDGEDFTRKNL